MLLIPRYLLAGAKCNVSQADVYDHMDFALTSLDMFAGISENLINYAFNVSPLPWIQDFFATDVG